MQKQEESPLLWKKPRNYGISSNVLLNGSWCSHKQLSSMPDSTSSTWNCNISQISILRAQRRYDNVLLICKSTILNSLVPCSPFWLWQKTTHRLKSLPTANITDKLNIIKSKGNLLEILLNLTKSKVGVCVSVYIYIFIIQQ